MDIIVTACFIVHCEEKEVSNCGNDVLHHTASVAALPNINWATIAEQYLVIRPEAMTFS